MALCGVFAALIAIGAFRVPWEGTRLPSIQVSRLEMGGEAQTGLGPCRSLRPWQGPLPFILPTPSPFSVQE